MNLFPELLPFDISYLKVDEVHTLYLEQCGNPNGVPIVFLHGGPGAGVSNIYRRFFDPSKYRIIMFDQRGSGKSTPYACIDNNTSQLLVEDIKKILNHLSIESTIFYGGSWGSTLALLFAQAYPSMVKSLVLRGIFLCRKNDIKWFYQSGANQIYADSWQIFIDGIPKNEQGNILQAFHKRIHGQDKKLSHEYSKKWAEWEGRSSSLLTSKDIENQFSKCSVSLSKIETHYFINDCFIEENQILNDIEKIQNIPCEIIHGRYDIVCPFIQAYDLQKVYPKANLNIIADSGHSLLEYGIKDKILEIFAKPDELI